MKASIRFVRTARSFRTVCKMISRGFILSSLLLFCSQVLAIVDGHEYPFDNQKDAERFALLAEELRCPKCQNQNLADSNAPIAKDLRNKVYEQIQAGQSNEEIVQYLVDRYGDFVRYKPAFKSYTLVLWLSPVVLFIIALIVFIRLGRGKKVAAPLTEEELEKLNQLKQQAQEK